MKIADPMKTIKALLELPFWPPTLDTKTSYTRFEDDSRLGTINVQFTQDGDGWIVILCEQDPNECKISMRFRMPMIGGGQSPRVRNALLILAEAIRMDNLEHPQDRRS